MRPVPPPIQMPPAINGKYKMLIAGLLFLMVQCPPVPLCCRISLGAIPRYGVYAYRDPEEFTAGLHPIAKIRPVP